MQKLATASVDGIQSWGFAPSWSVETEHPETIAYQHKDDDNLYVVEKLTYDEHGNVTLQEPIGVVEADLLTFTENLIDWKDPEYRHFKPFKIGA